MHDENRHIELLAPSDRLEYCDIGESKLCFTLNFTRRYVTVNFSNTSPSVQTRLFYLVLLHHISRLDSIDSTTTEHLIYEVMLIRNIRSDVETILCKKLLRKQYATMKYHFDKAYGELKSVVQGFQMYPPPKEIFFAPTLVMDKYREDKVPIFFFNDEHVVLIDFKSFKFDDYVVFVDPKPVFDPEANMIIRNVSSNCCRIQPKFLYQTAPSAKLASASSNNSKRFMFLLLWNDMYFRVLAIYPSRSVRISGREKDMR